MKRRHKLTVENLEAREVPTVFGTPWQSPEQLTLSFAPDGTKIPVAGSEAGTSTEYTNSLHTAMNSRASTPAWQREILRAFQTWSVQTNINVGLVADSGQTFGNNGLKKETVLASYGAVVPGATTYGDIRIGAYTQSPEVIATSSPYSVIAGAVAGDLLFNSSYQFSLGGSAGTKDLYTVALHEPGNIYGLSDSSSTAAAMYGSYTGVRTGLTAEDVSRIQSLYGGARKPDIHEGTSGNDTITTAKTLAVVPAPKDNTKRIVEAIGDLRTTSDKDHFRFTSPSSGGGFTVRLETVGRSLLNGRVEVLDITGRVIASGQKTDPLGGDVVVTLNSSQVMPNTTYILRVTSATQDVFGVGAYRMRVGFGFNPDSASVDASPLQQLAILPKDKGRNDTQTSATVLNTRTDTAANSRSTALAEIETQNDSDFYRLTAPMTLTTGAALTVTVRPLKSFELFAAARVFNSAGTLIPAETLVNGEDGRVVLQVANPVAGATYFVEVRGVGKAGNFLTGDYIIDLDFNQARLNLASATTGNLDNSRKHEYKTLTVPETQSYHFVLGAEVVQSTKRVAVRMTIFNADGTAVFTRVAEAGQATSGQVLLSAGTYTVKFTAATQDGSALPSVAYTLKGLVLSDPIDPYPVDPTDDPTSPPPPPQPQVSIRTISNWFPQMDDPFGDPWCP